MLIYHPAYDAYHCSIRMIALLTWMNQIDIEKARILDFYLAFPGAATELRLPSHMTAARRVFQSMKNVYRDPVSAKRTFTDMRHVQLAALSCLAAAGIVDGQKLREGVALRTAMPLPIAISRAVEDFIAQEEELLDILGNGIANIPTAGPNGLKDRSQLLEYRYDPV